MGIIQFVVVLLLWCKKRTCFRSLRHLSNEELPILKTVFSKDSAIPDISGFSSFGHISFSHWRDIFIIYRKKDYKNRSSLCFSLSFLCGYWDIAMDFIFSIALSRWDMYLYVEKSRILVRSSVKTSVVIHINIALGILRINERFNKNRWETSPR